MESHRAGAAQHDRGDEQAGAAAGARLWLCGGRDLPLRGDLREAKRRCAVLSLDIPVRENQKEWDTHGSAGYRPRAISGYQLAGADQITTLWDKGTGWSGRYALPAAQYDATVEEYTKREMRLAFLTGFSGQGGTRFNLLWAR